jgi:23S rRNA pseudouridine1911/1915/1917 synthase
MASGTKQGRNETVTVDATDAGERLDRLIARRLAPLSRSRVKALIESGHVGAAGQTITEPSLRVKPGQSFAIFVPDAEPALPQGQAMALAIVHEDEDLIVIDKPAGMVVHPAPGNPDATLVNALIAHCGDSLSGIGGVRRPGIVHRLDKDTSGLIVAAKTDRAHAGLARQFAEHSVDRAYRAVVWGVPRPAQGEISGRIGRSKANRKKMAVVKSGGREALTRYRVLRRFGALASLVECRLATGRTHQIRVHMTNLGHPLVGDPVYGRRGRAAGGAGTVLTAFPRQALHAFRLGFVHPLTAAKLMFESENPLDIKELISSIATTEPA